MQYFSSETLNFRHAQAYKNILKKANIQFEILLKRVIDFEEQAGLFEYQSPEVRFGDKKISVVKHKVHISESDIAYKKLREDVTAMYKLFFAISKELSKCGGYNVLILALANMRNKQSDEYKILNSSSEKQYTYLHRHVFDLNEKLKHYKDQQYYLQNTWYAEEASISKRILFETGYMTRWMKAQIEIQNIALNSLLSKAENEKQSEEKLRKQDHRINMEITSFYRYSIESLQETINSCDLKRDTDEAELVRKNYEMSLRRDEMKDKISALQQIYDERKKQIDDYLLYKEMKKQELEEQRLREIENEEMNVLEIEMQQLKHQELLRKKYLAKKKKLRKRA